jgi:hypothetical protein
MRIALKIILGLIVFGFIGGCIYFVGGVSATYPPIRKYDCNGSVEQFGSAIQRMALSDSGINLKISRRDSSRADDGGRDMVIKIKRDTINVLYDLVCDEETGQTEIKLVGAHNYNNTVGGYRTEDTGVKEFLNYFENDFLDKLNKQQGITLNPDKSFWGNFSLY